MEEGRDDRQVELEGFIQRSPLPWASLHALRDRQLVWVGTQGVSPTAGSRLACHKVK